MFTFLKIVLFGVGKFIGFLCMTKCLRTFQYKKGSISLHIWTNIVCIIQIFALTYIFVDSFITYSFTMYDEGIDLILEFISGNLYTMMFFVMYGTAMRNREKIIELFNLAMYLHRNCCGSDKKFLKIIAYRILFKITIDVVLIIGLTYYIAMLISEETTIVVIFFQFIEFPIMLTTFCFATTSYFGAFLYSSFLLHIVKKNLEQRIDNNIDLKCLTDIGSYYQAVLKFRDEVNKLFKFIFILFLLESFVTIVIEVNNFFKLCYVRLTRFF